MGYMGIALKIDKNRFQYWFYSDFKSMDDPTYPLSGEVEIKKNTIHLKCREHEFLYSEDWHLVIYKNQICLLADNHYKEYMKTDNLDDSRLLYKVREKFILNKKNPQMNAPFRTHIPKTALPPPQPQKENPKKTEKKNDIEVKS
jgi:hypothetical protein